MILSTTDGSDSVEVSPSWSSSPAKIFLKMRLIIFPLRVFGRSGTMKTIFGAANGPMLFLTCMINSLRSDCVMLDESCFDFCSGETVAGYVYDVVDTATNPVVALVVTSSTIASELVITSACAFGQGNSPSQLT